MSERSPPRSPCVLVLEDEVFVGLELSLILEGAGYSTLGPAPDVQAAEELLAQTTPDFAILDVNLEGVTSASVARLLEARGVPFVYMSGYTDDYMDEHLPRAPFFNKPVQPALLLKAIEAALRSRAGPGGGPGGDPEGEPGDGSGG